MMAEIIVISVIVLVSVFFGVVLGYALGLNRDRPE